MGSGNEAAARQRPTFLPCDLHAEWDVVIQARCNLLLVGPSAATKEMLVALEPHVHEPLRQCTPKTGVPMPQPLDGTLVMFEVAMLDLEQQAQLLWWLDQFDGRRHVQVVSTTSEPLFPLVETGAFLANLYYRLNVVRMNVISSGETLP